MPFIGKQSTSNSQITNYTTTVGSGGQTNFTVVIEGGDETHVYLNGVLLKETTDYTVSSTQVSLVSPAVENDIVEIKVFRSFALADAVKASDGGTFSGDVTVPNLIIGDGGNIGSASDTDAISISSGGVTTFSQNVDINGKELILDADGDTSITADTNDQIDFRAGGTDSVKIGNEHLTINDGNLVIGTAGKGITFQDETNHAGATISNQANTLDSYETGYWEPAISSNQITSGTLTIASSTPKLTYVRIGPLVFISGRLEFTASSPTGEFYIENLPFLIADLSSDSIKNHPSISVHFTNLASSAVNSSVAVYMPSGNSIRIRDNINSTGGGSAFANHIDSGTQLYIGGFYYTT